MRARNWAAIFGGILSLMVVGCGKGDGPTGVLEARIDVGQRNASSITRVTLQAGSISQDLTRDPATGNFNGSLILPVGTHSLVARAYVDTTQVGESAPTPVTIQQGSVMRVTLRILDTTGGGQPNFGPIITSLTYPTSTQVNTPTSFAVTAVAPDNAPVAIEWTDDCEDSTFSAPQSPTTNWSRASEGSCIVTVTATANARSVTETFSIVVFPQGSSSGAVDVSGVFVSAPYVYLTFSNSAQNCQVYPDSFNATCSGSTASPSVTSYSVSVSSWGASTPGSLEVSDNCGGRFGTDYRDPNSLQGRWLPPVEGAVCVLTARAVNGDGVAATLSAAVLVRAGTPRSVSAPQVRVDIFHPLGGCSFFSGNPSANCQPIPSGTSASVNGFVDWLDGLPGTVSATDDCGGTFSLSLQFGSIFGNWSVPASPGATCTVTVQATNLEGLSSQAVGVFPVQ